MRNLAVVLILMAFLISGCFGHADDGSDIGNEDGTREGQEGNGEPDDEGTGEEDPGPKPTRRITLYLTADGRLVDEPPEPGRVDIAVGSDSVFGTSGWTENPFSREAGENGTWLVAEDAEMTAWIEPQAPLVAKGFGDFVVHLGTTRTVPIVIVGSFPEETLEPGQIYPMTVAIPFNDILPMYAAPGEEWLTSALSFTPADSQLDLLVGGDHPTSITLSVRDGERDLMEDLESEEIDVYEGTLSQPGQICTRWLPGVTHDVYSLEVPDDATLLEVRLEQTAGSVNSDLDVDLFLAGARVGGGHKPTSDDGAFFVGESIESLRGESLDMFVTSCHSANTDYRVTVYMATGDPETQAAEGGSGF